MIDVFFCMVSDRDSERVKMAGECLNRWMNVPWIHLHILSDVMMGVSAFEFQRRRRMAANGISLGSEYIVADDDCLLPDDFDMDSALRVFRQSDFSVLSLMPSNANIVPWTPEGWTPVMTADVMEVESVGGIRFCQKRVWNWPFMREEFCGYDAIHADSIRAVGGRVGYFRNFFMTHLGEGKSSIWETHLAK